MSPLLEVCGVTVRFGGLIAVEQVSIEVPAGHVTGVIGPNGAGKTTLFNVISGLQPPTAGVVRLAGEDITRWSASRRARAGIARTFQRLEVFGSMTVGDNVLVAAELHRGFSGDRRDPSSVATEALERVGVQRYAGSLADAVPTGIARLVEVARALTLSPRVLLLDEPSSGLSGVETAAFADLLRGLAATGTAVLLVEHDVELVMGLCDTLHVLDFGQLICTGPPAVVQSDLRVQEAYLGAPVTRAG